MLRPPSQFPTGMARANNSHQKDFRNPAGVPAALGDESKVSQKSRPESSHAFETRAPVPITGKWGPESSHGTELPDSHWTLVCADRVSRPKPITFPGPPPEPVPSVSRKFPAIWHYVAHRSPGSEAGICRSTRPLYQSASLRPLESDFSFRSLFTYPICLFPTAYSVICHVHHSSPLCFLVSVSGWFFAPRCLGTRALRTIPVS